MKRCRTLMQRITQLGNIAMIEGDLMKKRGQHGFMPRTNKAKHILWQYQINLFGCRELDLEFGFPKTMKETPFTTEQFQGKFPALDT